MMKTRSAAMRRNDKVAPFVPEEKKTEEYEDSLGDVFQQFAEKTTIAGCVWISSTKLWINKLPWIIFFLACLGMAFYQLVFIFKRYYSYPSNTKIDFVNAPLDFPSVSICNINAIRASEIHHVPEMKTIIDTITAKKKNESQSRPDSSVSGNYQDYTEDANSQYYADYGYSMDYMNDFDLDYPRTYDAGDSSLLGEADVTTALRTKFKEVVSGVSRDLRKSIGHLKNVSVLNCVFNGRQCDTGLFSDFTNIEFGNCWTFNSHFIQPSAFKTRFTGVDHGLTLHLFLESSGYLPFTEGNGFRVVIHPFGSKPFPLQEGLSITPGKETNFALSYTDVTRLGGKFGKCSGDDYFKETFNVSYSTKTCSLTCKMMKTLELCQCFSAMDIDDLPLNAMDTSSICKSDAQLDCMENVTFNVAMGNIGCECHQACRDQIFHTEASSHSWPEVNQFDDFRKAICSKLPFTQESCQRMREIKNEEYMKDWYLKTDFLSVRVYFKTLTFTKLQEIASYPLANFASDIGGSVGLWLGLSVYSGVELLNLVLQLLLYCCRKYSKC